MHGEAQDLDQDVFLGRERAMLKAGIEKAKAAFQAHNPRDLDGMLTEMLATGEDRRFLSHYATGPREWSPD